MARKHDAMTQYLNGNKSTWLLLMVVLGMMGWWMNRTNNTMDRLSESVTLLSQAIQELKIGASSRELILKDVQEELKKFRLERP